MSTFAMLLYCFFSAKFVSATTFSSAFWVSASTKKSTSRDQKALEKVVAKTNLAEKKQYKKY